MSTKREKTLAKEGLSEPELIFDIDKYLLDDEWLNQPKLYFRWAVQLEDARADLENAKSEFDLTKAEIDLEIRSHPDRYSLPEKITENMIKASIPSQPEHKEAEEDYFTAKYRVGVLQAAVTALDHRKRALEKLVDLHGQKYFASPRASNETAKETVEEIEKKSVRTSSKVRSGKKRKRDHSDNS